MQEMEVPEAREGSFEEIIHSNNPEDQLLIFKSSPYNSTFDHEVPHRAIGVVYNPHRERNGNYVDSLMKSRYDAFIYIEETNALHPFVVKSDNFQVPDTYPFGI
jgi:erythromycin esterase-like protein